MRESSDAQRLLNAFTQQRLARISCSEPISQGAGGTDRLDPGRTCAFQRSHAAPVEPHDSRTEHIVETFLFESGGRCCSARNSMSTDCGRNQHVMIAWDHSARARGRSATRCQFFRPPHPFACHGGGQQPDPITQSGMSLVHHLREHGIYASFETVKGSGSSIGKVLGTWPDHAIDAIVMGASPSLTLNRSSGAVVKKTVIGEPPGLGYDLPLGASVSGHSSTGRIYRHVHLSPEKSAGAAFGRTCRGERPPGFRGTCCSGEHRKAEFKGQFGLVNPRHASRRHRRGESLTSCLSCRSSWLLPPGAEGLAASIRPDVAARRVR